MCLHAQTWKQWAMYSKLVYSIIVTRCPEYSFLAQNVDFVRTRGITTHLGHPVTDISHVPRWKSFSSWVPWNEKPQEFMHDKPTACFTTYQAHSAAMATYIWQPRWPDAPMQVIVKQAPGQPCLTKYIYVKYKVLQFADQSNRRVFGKMFCWVLTGLI